MLESEICLVTRSAALSPEELDDLQTTLGGTVRIAELLGEDGDRQGIVDLAARVVQQEAATEGKLTIGISTWADYGKPHPAFRIARDVKGILARSGRSVRMVTPPAPRNHLSAPQLIHNKLVMSAAAREKRALDLVCIWSKNTWHVGITRTVQDIAQYSRRDFGIPRPDAVSGMLPPKLAQTMVNLGLAGNRKRAIYDPFCGNGRILLEGNLLGTTVYGSDLNTTRVESSGVNLEWLAKEYGLPQTPSDHVWEADATKGPGKKIGEPFVIVSEPYLGKPLRFALKPEETKLWLAELEALYLGFFGYWANVQEKPQEFLVVFPRTTAANSREIAIFEAIVDRLGQMGYRAKVLFCYSRPDALVRRDLVKLTYR